MISMSEVSNHNHYDEVVETFNLSRCKWSEFLELHKEVSKNRCPICEYDFNTTSPSRISNSGNNVYIKATIDHYRPQKFYAFLKCEISNYLLMCSECNNIYKGSEFPLHSSTPTRAINLTQTSSEKPLIVNPLSDDLLELFTLVFRRSSSGKYILELKAKHSSGYLYEKAVETIKLFGLGDCEVNRHSNEGVFNCRIALLESHYGVFYNFAKALKNGDRKEAGLELRDNKELFESYGFYTFLKHNQFETLVEGN